MKAFMTYQRRRLCLRHDFKFVSHHDDALEKMLSVLEGRCKIPLLVGQLRYTNRRSLFRLLEDFEVDEKPRQASLVQKKSPSLLIRSIDTSLFLAKAKFRLL